ncbi:MAG TPA: sodium-independent anion transporter, partial [Sphingobium sp.]|nr:sodium-independent anion transporter [Sphingobium sp.]
VAGELLDTLRRLGEPPKVIILRMRLVPLLDASGVQALEEFVEQARIGGACVILSGVRPQPFTMLKRARLGRSSGKLLYTANYARALATAASIVDGG